MKTTFSKFAVITALAALTGGSAFADVEFFSVENDYIHTSANGTIIPGVDLDSTGRTGQRKFSDAFDLTADGFDPSIDTAFAGVAVFDVNDFSNPLTTDELTINLGPFASLNNAPATSYPLDFGPANIAILFDINRDGILDFSIVSQSGTFFLTAAKLDVFAEVPSVPDGGWNLGLLGFSLLGVAAAAHRFRPSAA